MKLWKKIAVCSTLALTSIAFSGCNCSGRRTEVSVDLDGDGIISDWETLFDDYSDIYLGGSNNSIDRVIPVNKMVEIYSLDDLKEINNKTEETHYYKLMNNIDCNGEEICINLGKSVFLGSNHVIKNFKIKEIGFANDDEQSTHINANVYGLIYNGVAVYDLRLFAGYQNINIDNLNSWSYVAPLVNVATVDNVAIKGRLDVHRSKTEGLSGDNKVDLSLGVANLTDIGEMLNFDYYSPNISNISTIGQINYTEDRTGSRVRIGSITSHLSQNGLLYNALSTVNISAVSTGTLSVGGIVGESDDLVSTATYNGKIIATYDPNSVSYIGGIAGRNFRNGELKNCVIGGEISFNTSVVTSMVPLMYVGGAVGRNLGIVNFIENNAIINVTNALNVTIGGICGSSDYGIFSNIINRADIVLTKCQTVCVAEICGYSQYGRFEQIVDMSTIRVENSDIVSDVKLGMVTIFELLNYYSTYPVVYNAERTPTFYGILMTGNVLVNQKKTTATEDTTFHSNYGLRNPYEYIVCDENGIPEQVQTGEEDGVEIWEYVVKTALPDQYDELYYLDSYDVRRYRISEDSPIPLPTNVEKTYAKDNENKSPVVNGIVNSRINVAFFVEYLGFKYGLNHNELDFSFASGETKVDLNNLTFVLSSDKALTKYFEEEFANGDLAFYDSYISDRLNYEAKLDEQSEFYSYLNALILSNTTQLYTPIKISHKFASAQDPEQSDSVVTLENNFARNVAYLLKLIFGVDAEINELSSDAKKVGDSILGIEEIKYEELKINDKNYRYTFTFQIAQMVNEVDSNVDNYIVYMNYKKDNKF